jgi:PAS domain S-box-containing protein
LFAILDEGERESVDRQNAHLQITERQYMNLLQAIPDIVYSLDEEGRFTYLNDAAKSLGLEPGQFIGKHFTELIEPEDVGKVSRHIFLPEFKGKTMGAELAPKLFDERRTGQRMTRNLELRLRHPNGAEIQYGSVTACGEDPCSMEGQRCGY